MSGNGNNNTEERNGGIKKDDIDSLDDQKWLTDGVINKLLSQVLLYSPNTVGPLLLSATGNTINGNMIQLDDITRARMEDFSIFLLLALRIDENHRCLAFILCQKHKAFFVDSFASTDHLNIAKDLLGTFIDQFLPDRHQAPAGQSVWQSWEAVSLSCAQQRNARDCGVYAIAAAFRFLTYMSHQRQIDVPTVRRWLKSFIDLDAGLPLFTNAEITSINMAEVQFPGLSQSTECPDIPPAPEGSSLEAPRAWVAWRNKIDACAEAHRRGAEWHKRRADEFSRFSQELSNGSVLSTSIEVAEDRKSTFEEIQDWLLILDTRDTRAKEVYAQKRQEVQENSDALNESRARVLELPGYDNILKGSFDKQEELLTSVRRGWKPAKIRWRNLSSASRLHEKWSRTTSICWIVR